MIQRRSRPEVPVTIGLGSNRGARFRNLCRAVELLRARDVVHDVRCSPVAESAPLGPARRPFLNAVLIGTTGLAPAELLAALQDIERALGRRPGMRWGPRPIDLDILDHDGRTLATPDLILPHPAAAERAFVLEPWAALAPAARLPGRTATIGELRDAARARPAGEGRILRWVRRRLPCGQECPA